MCTASCKVDNKHCYLWSFVWMLNILSQFIKYFTLLYLSLPSPHGDAIISTNSIFYLNGSLLAQVEIPKSPSKYFLRCHKNEWVSNIGQLVIILISREQGQVQVAMLLLLGRSNGRKYLNLHRPESRAVRLGIIFKKSNPLYAYEP